METPFKNIYTVLRLNRIIVLAVIGFALISTLSAAWVVYDMHQKSLNNAFAISTDGSVIPLKWVSQRENLEVEVLAHLDLFHRYFYNIDASNFENHLEKALWLGNSSVDDLYRQKRADGVYNRLIQYSLVQHVVSIESQVDLTQDPYRFTTTTVFEINRGSVVDTYELQSTGQLIHVDRHFPHNTHGLLITNYFEQQLRKVASDTPKN